MLKKTICAALACLLLFCVAGCVKKESINLKGFTADNGIYQYPDVFWGASVEETAKNIGADLGQAQTDITDVKTYYVGAKYNYSGFPASVSLEFYQGGLYSISFSFFARDAGKISIDDLYSEMTGYLVKEYGDAKQETFIPKETGFNMQTDSNLWLAEASETTSMQLFKVNQNGEDTQLVLNLCNISLSPKVQQ